MISPDNEPLFDHFFVARQPIFNNFGEIWGYELLYRNGSDKQSAEIENHDIATLFVATCGFSQSQEFCDPSKMISINFTEKLILEGAPRGLPASIVVVEVRADEAPSGALLDALLALKADDYRIALEAYTGQGSQDALLDMADIVKIDTMGKTVSEIEDLFLKLGSVDCMKLAERVDCRESVEQLRALGCDLYQGFFFAKPVNMRGRTLKSTQLSKLRILQEIEQPELDVDAIKDCIKADPSVTYRLMRFLNSSAFGFHVKIESISHAIRLIGIKQLKYWLRMAIMADLSGPVKTPELYFMGLNRGRFLEEVAQYAKAASPDPDSMFLFGMLSLMEPMLDVPLETVIGKLPLSDVIKSGLFEPASLYGRYLQLILAIENADTPAVEVLCRGIQIDRKWVAVASRRAMAWTYQMSQAMQ